MKFIIRKIHLASQAFSSGSFASSSAFGRLASPLSHAARVVVKTSSALSAVIFSALLVFSGDVRAQGLETFDEANIGGAYSNGSFVGNGGITWSYVHARDEGTYPISGNGLMLRRSDEPSSLSATIPGGIGNFSVDTRKAFTGNTQRRLELVINGLVVQQFEPAFADGTDETVIPFSVPGINTGGQVELTLRLFGAVGNQQITLDNIAWTAYPPDGDLPPLVAPVLVSGIGLDSAVISSEVTSDGGATVTARGFLYSATSENANPSPGDAGVTDLPSGSGLGVFEETLSGLSSGTGYSVRSYAANNEGTTYSAVATFVTDGLTPELNGIVPYTQNFAGFTSATTLPNGWTVSNNVYNGDWGSGFSAGLRGNASVLGFQHTGTSGIFTATLTIINNTGGEISALLINYLGKVERSDQGRSPEWSVAVNSVAAPTLAYSTLDGVDKQISAVVSGLAIPAGESFTVSWSSDRGFIGGGSSKQIGISEVEIDARVFNVDAPIFSLAPGTYFEDQTVFVTNFNTFTESTEVRYTTNGTEPNATSSLYQDAQGIQLLDGNGPVTLKAIAIDGEDLSPVTTATYSFPLNVANIAALRSQATGSTVYRVTNQATLIGQTAFRNTKIFQDDSGSGIQIDDFPGLITSVYNIGDNVAGLIGSLSIFQNQLQMAPVADPGSAVSTGNSIEPVVRTLASLTSDDQSRLVIISDIVFAAGDGFTAFGGGGFETALTDPSLGEGQAGIFRNVVGESNITGSVIPSGPVTVTGFIQQNNRGLTLAARSMEDIVEPPPVQGNGAGFASLSNEDFGVPYQGRTIFGGSGTQTLALTVSVGPQDQPLRAVSIALPAGWSGLAASNVSLSGSGFQGASVSIVENSVVVVNTDLNEFSNGTATISGVSAPAAEEIEDFGVFTIQVSTAIAGGELTPIKASPKGNLIIPIEMLRGVDANGVPLANGEFVAVTGVVTLETFVVSGTRLTIYIQDETAGISVDNPVLFDFPFFFGRGERYTAFGRVGSNRGLTQIAVPSDGMFFVNLGDNPEPKTLTIAQVLLNAEAWEGSLIRLQGLELVSGAWPTAGNAANLTVTDRTGQQLTLRISGVADISDNPEPAWPIDLVGVFSQFAQVNPPFTGGYQIIPREYADFAPAAVIVLEGFESWQDENFLQNGITDPFLTGADGDPDGDGVANLLEYALGGNPLANSRDLLPELGQMDGFLTLSFNRVRDADDIVYLVDASDDLGGWSQIWSSDNHPYPSNDAIILQLVSDSLPVAGAQNRFLRLRVNFR